MTERLFSKCNVVVAKVWKANCECQQGLRNATRCHLTKVSALLWILPGFEVIKARLWQFWPRGFSSRQRRMENAWHMAEPTGWLCSHGNPLGICFKALVSGFDDKCTQWRRRMVTLFFFSVARRSPVNFSSVTPRSDGAAAEKLQNECKRWG